MSSRIPSENVRPLPARPNLEFEKKRAKKLVKEHAGAIKLADAQLQIAREYGFASWRKLSAYYITWQAHDQAGDDGQRRPFIDLDRSVRNLLTEFAMRHAMVEQPPDTMGTGAALAAYIPRFYGLTDEEIFSSTIAEAEAQLVVARRSRFSDWKSACEFAASQSHLSSQELQRIPMSLAAANRAVHESNIDELTRLIRENPEWTAPPVAGEQPHGPVWDIIRLATRSRTPRTTSLLRALGSADIDLQSYLNLGLLGSVIPRMTTEEIQGLLELGADPNWKPRNGFSVLEHAIIRYGNGDAVDLIATRVVPRKAFWIAAGIGDVRTMLQFVDRNGVPNESARQNRPDASILGTGGTVRPDASDREVVWEAFMMAALNSRANAMKALLERGFPVDYTPVWYNALHVSVSYRLERSVEFLLANGANPDFKAWPDQRSPRDLAQAQHDFRPDDAAALSIHALLVNIVK